MPIYVDEDQVPAGALPASRGISTRNPAALVQVARNEAESVGLDPNFAARMVGQESRGNPDAVSPKGAFGAAQLMPETAAELARKYGGNPRDPVDNVRLGVRYLKEQMDTFGNNPELAAAAYNAGPGAVKKYGGVPPYKETQDYVNKVVGGGIPVSARAAEAIARNAPKPAEPMEFNGVKDWELAEPTRLATPMSSDVVSMSSNDTTTEPGMVGNALKNTWDFAKDTVLSTLGLEDAKSTSTGGDLGRALGGQGVDVAIPQTVTGINRWAGGTPSNALANWMLPEQIRNWRDAINDKADLWFSKRSAELQGQKTPLMQESAKKEYWQSTWDDINKNGISGVPAEVIDLARQGKLFGSGWGDWRKVSDSALQSAPVSILSMVPVMRMAGTSYQTTYGAAMAANAGEDAARSMATKAAERTAMLAGGASEGITGAGQQYSQTYQQVMDMPAEKLMGSKPYMDALAHLPANLTSEERAKRAREMVAHAASSTAAIIAGVSDALLGGLGDKYLGSAAAGKYGRAGSVLNGILQELPTETGQSALEQFGTNLGIQQFADPTQRLSQDVGEQAVGGGLSGGLMGGVMGGAAYHKQETAAPDGASSPPASAPSGGAVSASEFLGAPAATPAIQQPQSNPAEQALLTPDAIKVQPRPELKIERGAPTEFSTETGVRLQGDYALVDADALIASHDTNLRPNPDFPAVLQPRDRERAASALQISNIVTKLNPERLGASPDVANGVPIIGEDGLVESGNARTIALQRVYQADGANAQMYRDWLRGNAEKFGIAPEAVDSMAKPVLVRVRNTPVNRAEFARQANTPTVAAMSPLELAKSDAARIGQLDDLNIGEEGDFSAAGNRDFINRFVGGLAPTEQAGLLDSTGRLSQTGYARVRNAILAKAYGDSPTLMRMVESIDANLRNLTMALIRVAPQVAKAREAIGAGALHDADLTTPLLSAVEELSQIKNDGKSVADYLAQHDMLGDKLAPEARELLGFLDANLRSPKRVAQFVSDYFDALAAFGNPNQETLFGAGEAPTTAALIDQTKEKSHADNASTGRSEQSGNTPAAPGATVETGKQQSADSGSRGESTAALTHQTQAEGEQERSPESDLGTMMLQRADQGRTIGFDKASDTVIADFRNDAPMKASAHYKAAKAGDVAAAARLVKEMVKPESIAKARAEFGPDVIYLPVYAQEASGHNQIPNALAAYYSATAGGNIGAGVVQTNKAFHTGAKAMERLIARAEFDGPVEPGRRYVLVDDVTTMGGTLADLASYIRSQGGEVAGSVLLVNASRSATMTPVSRITKELEARHGDEIRNLFGIEPSALTADEAQYLIGFRTTDELRDRAAKAVSERRARLSAKGVSADEAGLARVDPVEPGVPNAEQRTARDDYTQDLFGESVPATAVPHPGGKQSAPATARDVLAAGLVPGARYATIAGPQTKETIRSAVTHVTSASDAAHTLAGLRKAAQERFQILVLDKSRKPLAVLDLFAGATAQAAVYPEIVTKAVYEVPGAAHIWYAHNHPSGIASPSRADEVLTRTLSQAFGVGTGIEVDGHIILAGSKVAELDADGSLRGSFPIPGGLRRHAIPVTQRVLRKVGTLGEAISEPADARTDVPALLDDKTGVVLTDSQNRPVAVLPFDVERMLSLRDGKIESGARILFGAVARSNAVSAFLNFADDVMPGKARDAATNLYNALHVNRGVRVLDAIHNGTSLASRGLLGDGDRAGVFFSRRDALSNEAPISKGVVVDEVKALAKSVTSSLGNAAKILVRESVTELPANLREHVASEGAEQDVRAIFDPKSNTIYVVTDNIGTLDQAEHAIFHDLFGHYGLRGILGDGYAKTLRQVAAHNANVRKEAATIRRQFGYGELLSIEEALADRAGTNEPLRALDRVANALVTGLRRIGLERMANAVEGMTNAEVRVLLAKAREFVRGSRSAGNTTATAPAMSRASQGQPNLTAEQRADQILAEPHANIAPLEWITSAPFKMTGLDRLIGSGADRLLQTLGTLVPERIKAGVISDYKVPQGVVDQRHAMRGAQAQLTRQAGDLLTRLSDLTRAESRVAYEWMNSDDPQSADWFREQLPPESIKTLAEVEKMIDDLSKQAVALGQLDPEAFKANRFAYLRRSYQKHTAELTEQEQKAKTRARAVLGEQYKGRGMTDAVPMRKIENAAPSWWKRKLQTGKADVALRGEKFIRLEKRATVGAGVAALEGIGPAQQSRLIEVKYFPVGETIPASLSTWDQAGTWIARNTKGNDVLMWRDFTKEERVAMGEIDEVRFAVAKTLHGMIHDVEIGKYLQWIAENHAKKTEADLPAGAVLADKSESWESMSRAFEPNQWIQVPETKIGGTQVKKYGLLAGRYLPGPIWNDVKQTTNARWQPFGQLFAEITKAWKVSKTALSPAVHVNNVMANFVMADWHDVGVSDLVRALDVVVKAGKDPAYKTIMSRFEDAGGGGGMFTVNELQREQLAPLLDALRKEYGMAGEATGMTGVNAAMHLLFKRQWVAAYEAATTGRLAGASRAATKALIDLYQNEDVLFRLAKWMKEKQNGASDIAAAKVARQSFLDYEINAPWVNAMRQTAMPFISFTYRAAPMLLDVVTHKPWKILKLGLFYGALNAIGYALSGGDEDKERKLLPEEKAGKIFGAVVPKLIRMPWNDAHDQPVFLDIRRWIPVGDIFDVGQVHSAVPILPSLMPSGPLNLLFELAQNDSSFTGKPIVKETDTPTEKAGKVADYLFKAFAPNLPILPGSYSFESMVNAGKGKTDSFGRELSLGQAAASGVGVKAASYPPDVLQRNLAGQRVARINEINDNMKALTREYIRKGISVEDYESKVADQRKKMQKINEDYAKRVQ